ncbi:N-acetylglutamate synthase-like GNAT family acetyltransferase [Xenorhabdus cabanillasii]|uniref:N-acetylglutamate synthase-like GNAT family acetyltransferase n=1 Tax=Xenorhabdus cabanillasii TaxID=351673 RepID=A0A3D9UE01_9GAMM|nr:GNAT family N-acetyltransferase [Xenorhabdus cabanillasii]REF26603.1 N-acetylglutamate synthase-like GNAT family acetyltransferase [Xenorhabdus cabanillasii]
MTIFPSAIQIRNYQSGDGKHISKLFREVYGDSYVYPDIYLPRLIDDYQTTGKWHSALAFYQGQLVGHASLVKNVIQQDQAELALIAVYPGFQGKGIAKSLGRYLCRYAKEQQYSLLTIKQVCSHLKSQYLAQNLGFCSTALMLDYVDSPFGLPEPESIVQGILPLKAFPLPKLNWPHPLRDWADQIGQYVGESSSDEQQGDHSPFNSNVVTSRLISSKISGRRLEITLYEVDSDFLPEIIDYPANQLIYLRLPACEEALKFYPQLKKGGFRFAGLCPDVHTGWFLLWLRGYQSAPYQFSDISTQNLYQMELGKTTEHSLLHQLSECIPG